MREIKVKAWHKGMKKFVDVTGLHYFEAGALSGVSFDDESVGEQMDIPIEWFDIIQYTGLKDRNGKEIYEGDITQVFDNRHVVKYGIARRDMASGWTVDIPCFYFDLITHPFKAFPIVVNIKGNHDLEDMKIIGNIYETPHLLQGE